MSGGVGGEVAIHSLRVMCAVDDGWGHQCWWVAIPHPIGPTIVFRLGLPYMIWFLIGVSMTASIKLILHALTFEII